MPIPIILIIIGSYLPGEKAGGPVRTTSNMVEWLGDEFEFKILTRDRDIGEERPYQGIAYGEWHTVGKAKVRYLAPEEQSLTHLRRIINSTQSDLLYIDALYSTLTLKTLLLRRLRLLQAKPIILVPRGQWRPEAMQIKARKKKLFMTGAKLVGLYHGLAWHVSSDHEKEDVVERVGKHLIDIQVIPNLPLPLSSASTEIQPRQKTAGSLRMVFLSRIVRNKGLHFVLELLSHVSGDIELDIYGSIQDGQYWEECKALIAKLPQNVVATHHGVAKFDSVIETLSQYHLFILPTVSENFGHAIVEALISGCPVLISDRTPWQDVRGAGWVLSLDKLSAWIDSLQKMVDLGEEDFQRMSEAARNYGQTFRSDRRLASDLKLFLVEQIEKQALPQIAVTPTENTQAEV
jgi:glycosyltransferase involved in cell wall biosynthesis